MANNFSAIAISLLPNFQADDYWRAFKLLFQPWKLGDMKQNKELVSKLEKYFDSNVILTDSARTAEYLILKALSVGRGDEVMIQAFTCVAVADAVVWNLGQPVYVDIDPQYNISPSDLKEKISSKTKAVIVQHSFGKPAEIMEIRKICKEKKITLVEDLAHAFGNQVEGKKLGSFGDVSFLSFGRDKVICGVWGGAIVTSDMVLYKKILAIQDHYPLRNQAWGYVQLIYIALVFIAVKTYGFFSLGKTIHSLMGKIKKFKVLSAAEKLGKLPVKFYRDMPPVLANLASNQLEKLDSILSHRKKIAKIYSQELGLNFDEGHSYLRFPIEFENSSGLLRQAAKENVFLGDWYDNVIAPKGVDLVGLGYRDGSCPRAEKATEIIANLPTNPNLSEKDAYLISNLVKSWKSKK